LDVGRGQPAPAASPALHGLRERERAADVAFLVAARLIFRIGRIDGLGQFRRDVGAVAGEANLAGRNGLHVAVDLAVVGLDDLGVGHAHGRLAIALTGLELLQHLRLPGVGGIQGAVAGLQAGAADLPVGPVREVRGDGGGLLLAHLDGIYRAAVGQGRLQFALQGGCEVLDQRACLRRLIERVIGVRYHGAGGKRQRDGCE